MSAVSASSISRAHGADAVHALQRVLYRCAKQDRACLACVCQPVNDVGEPCAGEPHARFEVAAGGHQTSRLCRAVSAPPADPTVRSPTD
jgi:hypothetical protein